MSRLPLLPNHAWFFELLHPRMVNSSRWDIVTMLEIPRDVSRAQIESAAKAVWQGHAGLRLNFPVVNGERFQEVLAADTPAPISHIDLSAVPPEQQSQMVERLALDARFSLSIAAGRLLRFVHLRLGPTVPGRLLVVSHHLLMDAFSSSIVNGDLARALAQAAAGEVPRLPVGARYEDCVEAMHEFAATAALREVDYWTGLAKGCRRTLDFETPPPEDGVTLWSTMHSSVTTRVEDLGTCARELAGGSLEAIAVAGVGDALTSGSGEALLVQIMNHGRGLQHQGAPVLPARAFRTVGWFAMAGVHRIPARGASSVRAYVRSIAESIDRAPNRGLGLAMLRWATPRSARPAEIDAVWDAARVQINFAVPPPSRKQPDSPYKRAPEGVGLPHDLMEPRLPLHVLAGVSAEGFWVRYEYDPTKIRDASIHSSMHTTESTLHKLASNVVGGRTETGGSRGALVTRPPESVDKTAPARPETCHSVFRFPLLSRADLVADDVIRG